MSDKPHWIILVVVQNKAYWKGVHALLLSTLSQEAAILTQMATSMEGALVDQAAVLAHSKGKDWTSEYYLFSLLFPPLEQTQATSKICQFR